MLPKPLLAPVLIAVVVLVAGGWSTSSAEDPKTHSIVIEAMKFTPNSLEVKPGDTIVWVNKDYLPHTATAENKDFDSGVIQAGASWKYVVGKKGKFSYLCVLHPTMKGSFTVK